MTALALVLVDLVLGVWAARKRGDPITSAGLRRTLTKGTVYTLLIVAGHYAGSTSSAGTGS